MDFVTYNFDIFSMCKISIPFRGESVKMVACLRNTGIEIHFFKTPLHIEPKYVILIPTKFLTERKLYHGKNYIYGRRLDRFCKERPR